MTSRPGVLLVACLLALGLTGCVGDPSPAPSTTAPAFASDAEAYKAAEKVYREYVDAANNIKLEEPTTFDALFEWTTGDANAGSRKTFSQMHADGWHVAGVTRVEAIAPSERQVDPRDSPTLDVCLDVSDVKLSNAAGESVSDPNRPPVQSMRVKFELARDAKYGLLISSIDGRTDGLVCSH
ncbi:hypothetical protein [Microbacterium candidum]|uniref:Lipoprotein n=1 Tax=Microbacterium candidum TaxID=3041922 RepID=A0ABT7N1S5_9MICO|nr:hypothetical protein [Microbacterium sp. ASV49]MDL9980626.1 hypothetical protein [Microbacterium sp. ASV49]